MIVFFLILIVTTFIVGLDIFSFLSGLQKLGIIWTIMGSYFVVKWMDFFEQF